MPEESVAIKKRVLRPYPPFSLEESLVIANAIQEKNAGKPMKRLLLADAIGRKPTSSDFRVLLSSSYKYGLTSGTEKAEYISLTSLGTKVTRPTSEETKAKSIQEAALTPETFKKVFSHFKDGKFPPSGQFFENTLEQEFGIPREHVKELVSLLAKNGKFSGIIRNISGSPMVMFDNFTPVQTDIDEGQDELDGGAVSEEEPAITPTATPEELLSPKPTAPKPIFIAHGKNKKPLDQLTKLLEEFHLTYKVAINEPNSGRPIPQKVKDIMNECGSAIFIFSKDGEPTTEDGETIPNLNVVFELGAASVLYGDKVVIFKEDGLKFSSDFDSLGYISFETDKLDAQAMNLMKELISMEFLKVVSAQ